MDATQTTPAAPSLGCARCGDCCQNIPCYVDPYSTEADPDTDLGKTIRFMRDHWTRTGTDSDPDKTPRWECDQFDPVTRLCTAHEAKPPICADYPMYGGPGRAFAGGWPMRCSYLLDIPAADRPAGSRPLIPVEVIHRRAQADPKSAPHKDYPNHDQ